ncbi:MAG: hypothetical protein HDR09_04930 [Lachnospiraceae bacterium]|nr:hypothetical protein [Lachnospiraceae bacterium]
MKKRMPKIYTLILILLSSMIVAGCGEGFRADVNKKPDDDISKAIYEAVGRKKVYYYSKRSDNPKKIVFYEYLVHDYEDENILTDMVEAVNAVMKEKEMTEKIDLDLREKIPGGVESVASLSNYYEGENGCEQYEMLQCLYITGTEHSFRRQQGSPYDKISTYINLPDIKSLVVSEKIAKTAEEEGIDWYEIWPDLEHYKVLGE